MARPNKFIIGGVSIVLVVGVCIGVIVGVTKNRGSGSGAGGDDDVLSTTSKSVTAFCGQTDYKQQCLSSVSSVSNNDSATPIDFMKAAIEYTVNQVKLAANNVPGSIMKEANTNATMKMAAEDCQDLLEFAIDELQACFSMVGDSSLHTVENRTDELKNWLSAVMSYQQTCLDGFDGTHLKDVVVNNLQNTTELTSNALAMMSAIANILNEWGITFDPTSRRLKEVTDTDADGYPRWMSGGDRKLLAGNKNAQVTPNAIVSKDGSGQYKTIAAAIAACPKKNAGRFVIYVKAGIYDEYITITKDQTNIYMYGDGPRKTIVTGKKSFKDGITTFKTATFSVIGDGFICKSMGFQNTAGAIGHQAVALRVQSDRAAFYNCRMDGYQDTLYQQAHRQFYRNCVISGTIDFIFGDSSAIIQNSLIIVRMPMDHQQNTVTAHGRADKRETTGLVIQNCRIVPEEKLFPVAAKYPSYLGRPWKQYARTIIMESDIGGFIDPAGWLPWSGTLYLDTLYYAEYENRGPGAATAQRVKWKGFHVLTNQNELMQYTAGPFLQGSQWLPATGFPHFLGLKGA